MALAQKWPFFQLFFLGKIGQKNVVYDTKQNNRLSRVKEEED